MMTNIKCHHAARTLRALRFIFFSILVLAVLAWLSGCANLTGSLTVPTEFGDAVIHHGNGATSIDLTLPRK